MAMANLYLDSHGLVQLLDRNKIGSVHPKGAGVEFLLIADDYLASVSLDLYYVERRTCRHSKALALAHGEVVNATVLAHDLAVRRDQFAGGIGQGLALLSQVRVQKLLVVAAGNKADFLRVRLLGQRQSVLLGQLDGPQASSFRPAETECG